MFIEEVFEVVNITTGIPVLANEFIQLLTFESPGVHEFPEKWYIFDLYPSEVAVLFISVAHKEAAVLSVLFSTITSEWDEDNADLNENNDDVPFADDAIK